MPCRHCALSVRRRGFVRRFARVELATKTIPFGLTVEQLRERNGVGRHDRLLAGVGAVETSIRNMADADGDARTIIKAVREFELGPEFDPVTEILPVAT